MEKASLYFGYTIVLLALLFHTLMLQPNHVAMKTRDLRCWCSRQPSSPESLSVVTAPLQMNQQRLNPGTCRLGKLKATAVLGLVSSVISLNLASNDFNCQIPSAIGNLGSLSHLNFCQSNFMGHIPHWLGNLTRLVHLDLGYNSLNGTIPSSLGRLGQLNYLDLGTNSLTGKVPSFLGNLVQLKFLRLRDNMFIGKIPSSLGNLVQLATLDLSTNQLAGEIPSSIGSLVHLHYIDLGYNQLMGEIPPSFQNLLELRFLILGNNQLSANITHQYSTLGLGSCNLNGFPEFLRDQDELLVLDLSYNDISGQVPEWFLNVSRENLQYLNLSGNFLTSFVQDPIIFKWKELAIAYLSFNKLQGSIPQELTQLTSLAVFNVSYNRLTGPIPQWRQFATFENNSYKGNSGLCGTPLSRKCGDPKASPPSSPTSEEGRDSGSAMELDWKIVCMGYASGLVIGVVLGNCLITRRRAQRLVKNFGERKQRRRR
ncbi:LRR receptor-like serine/threonine-protein kinase ERL2 [Rhodamnia argentea]|uniref:LRR receptor-like serine/threonine-protein kinase ERL2 n=1 Tax=Rhodamnia argentea TaxID=178133 RepID=A0ABM3GTX8_9MYRT|nr:LRR receptor-like serine/threonine-protein kinase ERL2 [Rhodamnia argentea]